MNNQNVQNLVEYIRKNPNLSSGQLKEADLKVGYSKEEFNQALAIIAKSQISADSSDEQNISSASSEVLTSEGRKQTNRSWFFVILGVLIILTFGSKITVTTAGRFENKKQEEGHTQTSSLDLNNGIVYIQKGSVIRLDKTDPERPEIAIIKGDKAFVLDPREKTYTAFNTADDLGKFYMTTVKASLPLIHVTEDTQKGSVTWQKASNNEWQTDWKWKSPLDSQEIPVKVKIILDSVTNLIITFSMKFEDVQPWQDATFQYEVIEDMESLLTIPSDYKGEKLDFSKITPFKMRCLTNAKYLKA